MPYTKFYKSLQAIAELHTLSAYFQHGTYEPPAAQESKLCFQSLLFYFASSSSVSVYSLAYQINLSIDQVGWHCIVSL